MGRTITCAWSVLSRPSTSTGAFTTPTSCTSAKYFADVVGVHQLRFTVTDSMGVSSTCNTTITVNPKGDLWIELTWDQNNDMDLHLFHPSAGNTHTAANWLSAPYDCYFLNQTPSWDAAGTADNPSLDRDDIPGKGPENIRINVPSTTHLYTVGVHMYSYAASPKTVNATVKVYCGSSIATTETRAFKKDRDAWVVGTVKFSSAGVCTWVDDGFVFTLN